MSSTAAGAPVGGSAVLLLSQVLPREHFHAALLSHLGFRVEPKP